MIDDVQLYIQGHPPPQEWGPVVANPRDVQPDHETRITLDESNLISHPPSAYKEALRRHESSLIVKITYTDTTGRQRQIALVGLDQILPSNAWRVQGLLTEDA